MSSGKEQRYGFEVRWNKGSGSEKHWFETKATREIFMSKKILEKGALIKSIKRIER